MPAPSRKPRRGNVILVIGGARSGKSGYAQRLAETLWRHPLYLATAEVLDSEMADRIRLHRQARGSRWNCAEESLDIAHILSAPPPPTDGILLDCATLWLSNVLLKEGADGVECRKKDLLSALAQAPRDVIVVSNEVGMGIVPDNELGRQFRDLQGWLNQDLARVARTVVFTVAGIPMFIKGRAPTVLRPQSRRAPGSR